LGLNGVLEFSTARKDPFHVGKTVFDARTEGIDSGFIRFMRP